MLPRLGPKEKEKHEPKRLLRLSQFKNRYLKQHSLSGPKQTGPKRTRPKQTGSAPSIKKNQNYIRFKNGSYKIKIV